LEAYLAVLISIISLYYVHEKANWPNPEGMFIAGVILSYSGDQGNK